MSTLKKKSQKPARIPRARNAHSRQRQRLIDACISALHIYGPSRTTVEKVVAIARMSPGIVRFYFASRRQCWSLAAISRRPNSSSCSCP
jgi:AcrR family transcriptional regulator